MHWRQMKVQSRMRMKQMLMLHGKQDMRAINSSFGLETWQDMEEPIGRILKISETILKAEGEFVFMIKGKQYINNLDVSIQVLINPLNWIETAEEIEDLFLGDAEVWRRPSVGHADPLGGDFPLVIREGHNVRDVIFTSSIVNLADVAESLDKIDGVVEHGVFAKTPCTVVIATEDGMHIVDTTVKSEVSGLQYQIINGTVRQTTEPLVVHADGHMHLQIHKDQHSYTCR